MKVEDVITKYNLIVPFPWTLKKIKKAGLSPAAFFIGIGKDLEKCHDKDDPAVKGALGMILKLSDA